MNNREDNWFVRNRHFIFGFAVVVAILNIALLVLVPQQTPYSWSGEVTEYALGDDTFAEVRTLTLEGTLTSSVIGGTRFDGALTISGYPELADLTLHLARRDKRWQGAFQDSNGQPVSGAVHEVYGTKEFEHIAIDFWTDREEAGEGVVLWSMDAPNAHFLVPGAESRQIALRRYQEYVGFAQK